MIDGYHQALAAAAMPADQEHPLLRRDGSEVLVSWKMKVLTEGGHATGLLCSGIDVTERRKAQDQIVHMAYHDSLTGLPNRALLRESLDTALARARRHGHGVALLYLDLDDFKLVNDGLGHAAGDELLRAVALRLRERLRAEDVLAREGGDEFLVLLADLDEAPEQRVAGLAELLVDALRPPFAIGGTEFEINGSVGVSLFPRDASDGEGLLAHADAAMYEAKAAGRGQVRLFSGSRTLSPERLGMGRRLRRAMEDGELVLHWQPIVDLRDGTPMGAEALVRWEDPDHGLRAAGDFVPEMAAAGLLEQLDEWVAGALATQRLAWRAEGLDPFVGFNLGARSLDVHRIERIITRLSEGGLGLDRVTVEISESDALRDDGATEAALRRLHGAGLTLALDDFGVAYSSLSRLRDLPTEWIKVDRSFLVGVPHDTRATRVLDAILQLLDALGSRVIVEGVEDEQQLAHLRARGCTAGQGYLLGMPVPAAELTGFRPVARGLTH
jgi:diguanylate cyclase (GGDEF)-like protein